MSTYNFLSNSAKALINNEGDLNTTKTATNVVDGTTSLLVCMNIGLDKFILFAIKLINKIFIASHIVLALNEMPYRLGQPSR